MKKLIILIALVVVFALIFLVMLFFGRQGEEAPETGPTPTGGVIVGTFLVSSDPPNNATGVPETKEVIFTFSQPVTNDDIKILVGPDTGQAILFRGKTVIVRPIPTWNEGTPYRISIEYTDSALVSEGINFVVAGQTPDTLPDTGPNPTSIKQSEDLQREASPDVYLSNYTPYDTQKFTITSEYKAAPTGHFAFTVITKGEISLDAIEGEVKAWAFSHELSESQFQSLDISYQ